MTRPRILMPLLVLLAVAAHAAACGDGATEPPAADPPRATTLTVTPATAQLMALDETVQLSAEVRDQDGNVMAGAAVSWTSSAPAAATVSASGLVTADANGTATITATAGSASGSATVTVTDNPDRAALVALYQATDGPNWVDSDNWLTDAPLAEWYGVDTGASGRVVGLNLRGRWDSDRREYVEHGLSGPIPAEIGNLASLRTLDLGRNSLTGPIPSELGNLQSLEQLDLAGNSLTSPIPSELGQLASLNRLYLDSNNLTGPIPASLAELTQLTYLSLDETGLSGSIPPELGKLANLKGLGLCCNKLTGPIPSELANLKALESFELYSNWLTGAIPAWLGELSGLRTINLELNRLTGPIPPLGGLAHLEWLDLSSNELTGPIPSELGNLSNLTGLFLNSNRLSDPIPQGLLRLDRLFGFLVGRNESLCVPGSSTFVAWLRGIEYRDDDAEVILCNAADMAALKRLYQTAGGTNWTESTGWPGNGAVEEWHGVSADSLGRVTAVDLTGNGLAGRVPNSLGAMAHMTVLRVGTNPGLSGRLPLSLARLSLSALHYAGTGLCTPANASFREWLNGISSHESTGEQCAPLTQREILEIFYHATGGDDWTTNANWLTDAPLGQWHGVRVDGEDRVTELSLYDNNLKGPIPPELGNLANLTRLELTANDLTGPIPPELGDLSQLGSLRVAANELTGPIPAELGNLTNLRHLGLSFNDGMGQIPPELGNLVNLSTLDAPGTGLSGSIPPELGKLANLHRLNLSRNAMTGSIPPELGTLADLQVLELNRNALTSSIPPALGGLTSLRRLDLVENDLTGSIPGQLGNLSHLESLGLNENDLTGEIPSELGNLANLELLGLSDNDLTGPIPQGLGELPSVTLMALDHNALTGSLPPSLGNLTTVEQLLLDYNDLEGPVPPEFGGMSSLRELSIGNNLAMSGPLPGDLAALDQLEALLAGGTDLCAPSDPNFQSWLEGVPKLRIAPCAEDGPPAAYLTQAVQSREYPVPLVAGEKALLRVFVTAGQATATGIPGVRARFYRNGGETHVVEIPGKSDPMPTEVDESRLSKSANAEIPGHVIQPGLEMVIEVDPDGTLDPGLGVAQRIPKTGRLSVDVTDMSVFHLTVIPFLWSSKPDSLVLEKTAAMVEDPHGHELLGMTRNLLPIGRLVVTAHEPVVTSHNNAFKLVDETEAIRVLEGGRGYYLGTMTGEFPGIDGVANGTRSRASFSTLDRGARSEYVIAHELGHNMSLQHAGCAPGDEDPAYPDPNGTIGVWGYDFAAERLVPPTVGDLMTYCDWNSDKPWISDFHFTNALRYRMLDEGPPAAAVAADRSLLLWGGVNADAVPYLEPAFIVEAPAALPDSAGEYQVSGRTETGTQLFFLRFAMPETADGDGSSSFAFVLPVRTEWEENLASISLTGPGGSATLDGDSNMPVAILRNPQTGQIRGILRDPPPATQAAERAVGQGVGTRLDVLFSRGIPDAAAWRR
ncbi:MAG: Ig-like domain-containing protein [Gammaproteobacteria bacterium]|nr:Ig-like domain-containing protein [Gammaproteobacteria bacterium]